MLDIDDVAAPGGAATALPSPAASCATSKAIPDTPGLRLVAVLGQVLCDTPLVPLAPTGPRVCALTDPRKAPAPPRTPYKEGEADAPRAHIRLVATPPGHIPDHIPPGASLAYNAPQERSCDDAPRERMCDHAPRERSCDNAPPTGPDALQHAIALTGGQSALASALGLTQAHVWNWLNRGRVPAEHCPAIERATHRAVRCEALRPDVDWAYLRLACGNGGEGEGA